MNNAELLKRVRELWTQWGGDEKFVGGLIELEQEIRSAEVTLSAVEETIEEYNRLCFASGRGKWAIEYTIEAKDGPTPSSEVTGTGETPRTDALLARQCEYLESIHDTTGMLEEICDHARQLESDLTEARINEVAATTKYERLQDDLALRSETASVMEARGLLLQVRDEWYRFTSYSKLKQEIDTLLDTPGEPNRDVSAGSSHAEPDGPATKPADVQGASQGSAPILTPAVTETRGACAAADNKPGAIPSPERFIAEPQENKAGPASDGAGLRTADSGVGLVAADSERVGVCPNNPAGSAPSSEFAQPQCSECGGRGKDAHYKECGQFDRMGYIEALEAGNDKLLKRAKEAEAALLSARSNERRGMDGMVDRFLAWTLAAKQAEIDRLMLEYCPDEMTEEQKAEWAVHQTVVPSSERELERQDRLAYDVMADAVCEIADEASKAFIRVGIEPGEWDGDNIVADVKRGLVDAIERLAARSASGAITIKPRLLRALVNWCHFWRPDETMVGKGMMAEWTSSCEDIREAEALLTAMDSTAKE